MVISPPYCGVPSEFHQFPVVEVVVGAVVVAVVEVVLVVLMVVVMVVVVLVVIEVTGVVLVVQEAKIRDVTINPVNNIQVIPFFIKTSFENGMLQDNVAQNLFFKRPPHLPPFYTYWVQSEILARLLKPIGVFLSF